MAKFLNLKAEMARSGLNGNSVSKQIGLNPKSFSNKMIGKSEFTRSEMMAIQSVFEGKTIEYLFESSDQVPALAER